MSALTGERVAGQHASSRGVDGRARPQGIDGDAERSQLPRHPQHAHGHAVFGHGVGQMVAEPSRRHVEWRSQVENVRIAGLFQMWDAQFGTVYQAQGGGVEVV